MRKVKSEAPSKKLEHLLDLVAAKRDQAAFADLYFLTKGKLFSTSLGILKRRHLAEEIVQDCYARIWQKAEFYNASLGSPMNWMITIVRNMSIDVAKKYSWEICSNDDSFLELPSASPDALQELEDIEDQQSIHRKTQNVFSVLRALDPMKHDLVIAAYILGQSREQLSRKAGVPVSTVKTWLRRTLLEVREIMGNTDNYSLAELSRFENISVYNDLQRSPLASLSER